VVAILKTKPGMREAVLKEFQATLPAVRAEAGCIEYGPTVDHDGTFAALGPDTFVVIEKWESAEALKAHGAAPHMKAYGERVKDMMESRFIHILQPV
jgi:quinol monooxygenase YgiN